MTTSFNKDVCCAVYGKTSSHIGLVNTNAFGSFDLDFRPSENLRSAMPTWVQRCPECGYCARRIDSVSLHAKSAVLNPMYRRLLNSKHFPEMANAFLCQGLLCMIDGACDDAALANIHAAWVCDDIGSVEAATKCRNKAARLVRFLHEQQQTVTGQKGGDEILLTDLFRRSGKFDEALDIADKSLLKTDNELCRTLLLYEKGLISDGDTNAHTVEEARGG